MTRCSRYLWVLFCATSLLPTSPAFAQGCSEEFGPTDIERSLEVAELAFSDLDVDGFKNATDAAASQLPCVRTEVSRSLAARYHRFVGLRAFVDREQAKAVSSFAAARTIEPDYQFPETFIPSGNPVMNSYLALDVSIDEWGDFPAPSEGRIQLDGRSADKRSTRFPHVYQYFGASGGVLDTVYLFPEQRFPTYPGAASKELVEPVSVSTAEVPPREKSGPRVEFLIGAGVGVVAAGALYASAVASEGKYNEPDKDNEEELDRLRKQTNTKVIASAGLATISAGLGVSAFLVARW